MAYRAISQKDLLKGHILVIRNRLQRSPQVLKRNRQLLVLHSRKRIDLPTEHSLDLSWAQVVQLSRHRSADDAETCCLKDLSNGPFAYRVAQSPIPVRAGRHGRLVQGGECRAVSSLVDIGAF